MTHRILGVALAAALSLGGTTPEPRRIVGGTPATVYDYPFVVLIVKMAGGSPTGYCTGSLISDEWVLTAAHCVDGLRTGEEIWESEILVSHGYPEATETRHAVSATMHPDFDPLVRPEGWAHDLALIRLDSAFLSRTTATVALANANDGLLAQPGLIVTVVGWGGDGTQESMTAAERSLTACTAIAEWAVCTESLSTPYDPER